MPSSTENVQKCARDAQKTKIYAQSIDLCLFIRTSYIMVIHIIARHYLNTTPRALVSLREGTRPEFLIV